MLIKRLTFVLKNNTLIKISHTKIQVINLDFSVAY